MERKSLNIYKKTSPKIDNHKKSSNFPRTLPILIQFFLSSIKATTFCVFLSMKSLLLFLTYFKTKNKKKETEKKLVLF